MKNILKIFLFATLSITFSQSLFAQNEKSAASLAYDVDFQMYFDNREFYKCDEAYTKSMTIFAGRLTPVVGLAVGNDFSGRHKVMFGLDMMYDFGNQPQKSAQMLQNILMYYQFAKKMGKTTMTLTAGVMPKKFAKGEYSPAFYSDSLKFYDNAIEGLLLGFQRPRAYYEVACDWIGLYGQSRREKFVIFSAGKALLTDWLSFGYAGYLYHYANSREVAGVVDNILVNPYFEFKFNSYVPMQKLSLSLGWLQSAQHDRNNVGHYVFPAGAELVAEVKKWNFGITNRAFIGTDMMPYYNSKDAGGNKYGTDLYKGSPFYRVRVNGDGVAVFDKLECYYEPNISNYLKLRVGAAFYFNESYSGCQQLVSVKFNLEELLSKRR
jgi:hypothetical protein